MHGLARAPQAEHADEQAARGVRLEAAAVQLGLERLARRQGPGGAVAQVWVVVIDRPVGIEAHCKPQDVVVGQPRSERLEGGGIEGVHAQPVGLAERGLPDHRRHAGDHPIGGIAGEVDVAVRDPERPRRTDVIAALDPEPHHIEEQLRGQRAEWLQVDQHAGEVYGSRDEGVVSADACAQVETADRTFVEGRAMGAMRVPVAVGGHLVDGAGPEVLHHLRDGDVPRQNGLAAVLLVIGAVVVGGDRVPGDLALEVDPGRLQNAHARAPGFGGT